MSTLEILNKLRFGKASNSEITYIKKELQNYQKTKEVLQKINNIIASYYNDEIDDIIAFNAIDELLKEVDWRNEDEIK